MRCWPARGSARSIPSSSRASRPTRCRTGSTGPTPRWSSPPTTRRAAGQGHAAQVEHRRGAPALQGHVKCLVVRRTGGQTTWVQGRDFDYNEMPGWRPTTSRPGRGRGRTPAVHPLHLGLHGPAQGRGAHDGRLSRLCRDDAPVHLRLQDGDVFWCTADVGWVTGHSYIVYGPLANGATTLMFEGVPTWPDAGRFWEVCAKHKVNQFYTAPTAIRALMAHGPEPVEKHDLSSCGSWARWASRSTPRPGTGTTTWWARGAAPSSTPGGRPRPAAT
jgi:hypothetical protein